MASHDVLLAQVERPANETEIPVASLQWRAVVDQVNSDQLPNVRTLIDGPPTQNPSVDSMAYRARVADGAVVLEVDGDLPYQRTMIWSAAIENAISPDAAAYYCLRYRSQGIERNPHRHPLVLVTGTRRDGATVQQPLLSVDQVVTDNRWHTVVGKRPLDFSVEGIRVQLTTSDSQGWFAINRLSFHRSLPEIAATLGGDTPFPAATEDRFAPIDLAEQCNDSFADGEQRLIEKYGMIVDGGIPASEVGPIPFRISAGERNLIRPDEDPARNSNTVELLGTETTRHYFEPRGRDDLISVSIGKRGCEVYFLMTAEMAPSSFCYARPPWPRPVDDIASVAVELVYADGQRDFAFPYSVADGGYLVRRTVAAYAVSTDPNRDLATFVLHNRSPGVTFSLGALTVNTSATQLVAELSSVGAPIRLPELSTPKQRPTTLRREGKRILISNRFYDWVVNCEQGFSLESFSHRWSDNEIHFHPSSGIEVEFENTILTGRAFRTVAIETQAGHASVRLESLVAQLPLAITIELIANDTPELTMRLSGENTGPRSLEADIRFPLLREMTIGECDDTWLFFPQYRNVITNSSGAYLVPNDCRFPMQVCDIYNPRVGIGLALVTHNLDHRSLDYAMSKNERGVSSFVQAPGELYSIASGESIDFTESSLVVHPGDWHEAVQAYRNWLRTVSDASVAQTRDWFRRSFLLRNHQMKKFYDWSFPIYNAETQSYCIDACVDADTDYLEMKPQIAHLFGWIDLEDSWHGHPNGDFQLEHCTGGLEALKDAIHCFQDKHGIPTSLYTLSDRCYKGSEFGKKHGAQLAIQRKDGTLVQDEASWYLCGNTQAWRDQYVDSLCRTQRETGATLLYVDVFPFSRSSTCYSPHHGHAVPSHVNRGTHAMIRQLRKRLPDDVILWSEYPLPDMSLPYIDGNIHYYCLDWHEHFGQMFDQPDEARRFATTPPNVYRYAFPHLKQFIFLCGMSPYSGDSKFPFFNGEALYDCGWCLYASPHLDRIKKSLAIQRTFADCFASPNAAAETETLQQHVHANRFPGEGRIAWTFYNARYSTVRGPVLSVRHREGATYHDAWNDVPLEPTITDGRAILSLALYPQQLGCIIQSSKPD